MTAARYSFPGVGIATPTEGSTSGGAKQKYYSYNYGEGPTSCEPELKISSMGVHKVSQVQEQPGTMVQRAQFAFLEACQGNSRQQVAST